MKATASLGLSAVSFLIFVICNFSLLPFGCFARGLTIVPVFSKNCLFVSANVLYCFSIFNSICALIFTISFLPGGSDGKTSVYNAGDPGFALWVGKIRWRRKWQSTPVLLPGKSHGQRSLVGYSPWVAKSLTRLSDVPSIFYFTEGCCAQSLQLCDCGLLVTYGL